ncbi:hypothetical protein TNCV_4425461 [Trichonephila clavipes]|nr:hypothetical protein TNCV_4425461 [Trichonephila clavipes]
MVSVSLLMRSWVFCSTPREELFPVLREFVGVVRSQKLICLECLKHAIWDSSPVTRWPFCSGDYFLEKEIIHQISTMCPAVVFPQPEVISNCYIIKGLQ